MKPLEALSSGCRQAYRSLEHGYDAAFGAANPWRHLGSLAVLFFCIVVLTGVYLYILIDTSVLGAYRSIASLNRDARSFGGLMQSLHRYASDAFLLLTLLHLGREFLLGRYSHFRAFAWLTGVPLLGFAIVSGIGGFWLKWDQLAHVSAVATAEWLDALNLFAMPITRNFLTAADVNDRLFSLFVFVHIGVPLLLIFGLWFHVQRLSLAEVFPPRSLGIGTCATLLLLALIAPVGADAAADLSRLPAALALDWFYLWPHALMYASTASALWALAAMVGLALFLIPFLTREKLAAVAEVQPDNCNGCRRCVEDCPYAAIVMVPHPTAKTALAKVLPDLCARCGICAGACPAASPFRASGFVTGIDMPTTPLSALHDRLEISLGEIGTGGIIVFGCDQGAATAHLAGPQVATFSLSCVGMLPPSFVEFALRGGAAGVLVAACRPGGCTYRLGDRWTEERLTGVREPRLRASVDPTRLHLARADRGEEDGLSAALADFRRKLDQQRAAASGELSQRMAGNV